MSGGTRTSARVHGIVLGGINADLAYDGGFGALDRRRARPDTGDR
jgi:hypothetical protein